MKISVAVFDKDKEYTGRLADYFQINYSRGIAITVFSDEEIFHRELENQYFNMAVIFAEYRQLASMVPQRTQVALLVPSNGINEVDGIRAVGKYQRMENLYKELIGICAENSPEIKMHSMDGSRAEVRLFTSVQGGGGVSSAAAAYSMNRAAAGYRVFYLNLETFGDSGHYFHAPSTGSFSDVIYALKSSNINLALKLQSVVCRADTGVDFIPRCANAYDMLELKDSEIEDLVDTLQSTGSYDIIVIDYSTQLSERQVFLLKDVSDSVVYVSDGSRTGNAKFLRFCEAVRVIEKRESCFILDKMQLLYNRFSSQTSSQMEEVPIPVAGVIGRHEGLSSDEMIRRLAANSVFASI